MNGLEFTRGSWSLWLLALPLVWFGLYWLATRGARALAAYGAAVRDPLPKPLWRSLRTTLIVGLAFVCWLDPRWGDEQVVVERRGLDLLFCLDTSRSMLARDLEPDRLSRAKRDIRAVLPRLQGGDRVGLIAFAGQARLWIPLTHDLDSFDALLDEVDTDLIKVGGTDLAAALRRCLECADGEQAATTAIVLLTDGEDHSGAGRQAAAEAAAKSILVHAVGYGSSLGSKITLSGGSAEEFLRDDRGEEVVSRMDPDSLRALAGATGGEFLRADAVALPLVELHDKRLAPMQKRAYDAGKESGKQARYQWVLLPLLLLVLWDIVTAGGRHR